MTCVEIFTSRKKINLPYLKCPSLLFHDEFTHMKRNMARQWRTQKIFTGGFHSMTYGGDLYLVCALFDVTI